MPNHINVRLDLTKRLDPGVNRYMSANCGDVLMWLNDSFHLLDMFKPRADRNDFYEYSFLITPAFKALERWLLVIAPSLGVPNEVVKKAKETGRLGSFLKDDQIEIFIGKVLRSLDLEAKKKTRIRGSVQALNANLKNFRHTPAHCGNTIDNVYVAETTIHQIVGSINEITRNLIEDGLIKNIQQ